MIPIKRYLILILILGGVFIYLISVQAAVLGEQVNFYVDSYYDFYNRNQLAATLRTSGQYIYFYIENDYWNDLDNGQRTKVKEAVENLASEFDQKIYPKERAVFGSEWTPGIDNDPKITVLLTRLLNGTGGYINTFDEYPRSEYDSSNQREMIYLNIVNILDPKNKSYLAHEFQHLITFYQKTKLYSLEEEVWLNEARSEYAPTLCGYDEVYAGSHLADRVDTFLDSPSDSLTEWKNKPADYGAVALFIHYLADHYGKDILTRMILNNKTGIVSIEQALTDLGYQKTFSDVFADWAIADYLNNCQIAPANQYCYLDKNLTYQRLHTDPSASYSGFPNLIVSRSSLIKDWAPYWYRFKQGTVFTTDRDTLKLEFNGSVNQGDFRIPYIITDQNEQSTVQFMFLNNQQGTIYVPNFSSLNKTITIAPFNQSKKSNFGSDEPLTSFSFTASSITAAAPIIDTLSPQKGSNQGGFEIIIKGNNLLDITRLSFAQQEIKNFKIIDNQTIKFTAPAHSAGAVDITVTNSQGIQASLSNSFIYAGSYPDGSLIRAKGDYKVYIIKDGYRRWLQDSRIFDFYGHLSFSSVIEVSPGELAQYQESWLVRADGDHRVYEVNGDKTKHWLNMTVEEFTKSGRSWSMVYLVNSSERNFYQTGADVMYR